jgi:hypothetical protein
MKLLLVLIMSFVVIDNYAQDSTFKINIDTNFQFTGFRDTIMYKISSTYFKEEFSHQPDEEQQKLYDTAPYLINSIPNDSNYNNYFLMACTLWEMSKISEAKKMFYRIINPSSSFYTSSYYHSSDILGDTSKNIYGYGSYTSHFKNSASIYLTKIYIEEKKFDSAYYHLNNAINKYKEIFTCGTGYNWQQEQYRYLYGLCYEGLGREKDLFNLLLPHCFDWQNGTIIRAIKKKYSNTEIRKYLQTAIASITCKVDKHPSSYFIKSNYGEVNEKEIEIRYYGGTGSITLFGKKTQLPQPNDLKEGERVTRQYFVNLFKKSSFYTILNDNE